MLETAEQSLARIPESAGWESPARRAGERLWPSRTEYPVVADAVLPQRASNLLPCRRWHADFTARYGAAPFDR